MFHLRTDDYILIVLSSLLIQSFMPLWEVGERNSRVPKLIETARELWKDSMPKWLVKLAPLILVLMLSLWCLIRMVLPENEKLNAWLLVAVCFVPLIFNSFKLISSQRRLKE
jgi:uncharacterized BrkB/YihY/UPF0761 family membrane protein